MKHIERNNKRSILVSLFLVSLLPSYVTLADVTESKWEAALGGLAAPIGNIATKKAKQLNHLFTSQKKTDKKLEKTEKVKQKSIAKTTANISTETEEVTTAEQAIQSDKNDQTQTPTDAAQDQENEAQETAIVNDENAQITDQKAEVATEEDAVANDQEQIQEQQYAESLTEELPTSEVTPEGQAEEKQEESAQTDAQQEGQDQEAANTDEDQEAGENQAITSEQKEEQKVEEQKAEAQAEEKQEQLDEEKTPADTADDNAEIAQAQQTVADDTTAVKNDEAEVTADESAEQATQETAQAAEQTIEVDQQTAIEAESLAQRAESDAAQAVTQDLEEGMVSGAETGAEAGPEGAVLGVVLGFAISALFPTPNPYALIDEDLNKILNKLSQLNTQVQALEQNMGQSTREILTQIEITSLNGVLDSIDQYWQKYQFFLSQGNQNPADLKSLSLAITNQLATAVDEIDRTLIGSTPLSPTDLITQAAFKFTPENGPSTNDQAHYQQMQQVLLYFNHYRYKATILLVEAYHYLALDYAVNGGSSEVCENDIHNKSGNPYFYCVSANQVIYQFFFGLDGQSGLYAQMEKAGTSISELDSNILAVRMPPAQGSAPLQAGTGYLWQINPSLANLGTATNVHWSSTPPLPQDSGNFDSIKLSNYQNATDQNALPSWLGNSPSLEGFKYHFASKVDFQNIDKAINSGGSDLNQVLTELGMPNRPITVGQPVSNVHPTAPIQGVWASNFLTIISPEENNFVSWNLSVGAYNNLGCQTSYTISQNGKVQQWEIASPCNESLAINWSPTPLTTEGFPYWPVIDASSCPNGGGVNPAGWPKPCSNIWIDNVLSNQGQVPLLNEFQLKQSIENANMENWSIGFYNPHNGEGSSIFSSTAVPGLFDAAPISQYLPSNQITNSLLHYGDFNGDGLTDLVFISLQPNAANNQISTSFKYSSSKDQYLSQWNQPPPSLNSLLELQTVSGQTFSFTPGSAEFIVGDWNGDSYFDIGILNGFGQNQFCIFTNDKINPGSFAPIDKTQDCQPIPGLSFTTGANYLSGYVNEDSVSDIIVRQDATFNMYLSSLYPGQAQPTFNPMGKPFLWDVGHVTTADFNSDGVVDIALYNPNSQNNLYIQYGTFDSTTNTYQLMGDQTVWPQPAGYTTPTNSSLQLFSGNFSNVKAKRLPDDFTADIGIWNPNSKESIYIWGSSETPGTFDMSLKTPLSSSEKNGLEGTFLTGDFNNDGYDDVMAVAETVSNGGNGQTIAINPSIHYALPDENQFTDETALNGFFCNDSGSSFPVPSGYDASNATYLSGDWNGDGFSDMAVAFLPATGSKATVLYFVNNGSGVLAKVDSDTTTILLPEQLSAGNATVISGEFNGDNQTDLLFRQIPGTGMQIWFNQGYSVVHGLNFKRNIAPTNWDSSGIMKANDFNNDGIDDLALFNPNNGEEVFIQYGVYNAQSSSYTLAGQTGWVLPKSPSGFDWKDGQFFVGKFWDRF